MIKITIEIDTGSFSRTHGPATPPPTPVTKTIGFVSTIKVKNNSLQTNFESGVNNTNFTPKYKDAVGYKENDLSKLEAEITNFSGKDLIVTAGGLVAYEAASETTALPFLSLTGVTPTTHPANYKGGISLESYNTHVDRITFLTTLTPILNPATNYAITEIGLFYNGNAKMDWAATPVELNVWRGLVGVNTQDFPGGRDGTKNNDKTKYPADLAAIPVGIKALVISADPYFQDTMDDLVKACNDWIDAGAAMQPPILRYVCYPSFMYSASNPVPTKKRSAVYGPDLNNAYNLLGQRVSQYLNQYIATGSTASVGTGLATSTLKRLDT
jgi:hypothetical protein